MPDEFTTERVAKTAYDINQSLRHFSSEQKMAVLVTALGMQGMASGNPEQFTEKTIECLQAGQKALRDRKEAS
jgi:hypothetical protein